MYTGASPAIAAASQTWSAWPWVMTTAPRRSRCRASRSVTAGAAPAPGSTTTAVPPSSAARTYAWVSSTGAVARRSSMRPGYRPRRAGPGPGGRAEVAPTSAPSGPLGRARHGPRAVPNPPHRECGVIPVASVPRLRTSPRSRAATRTGTRARGCAGAVGPRRWDRPGQVRERCGTTPTPSSRRSDVQVTEQSSPSETRAANEQTQNEAQAVPRRRPRRSRSRSARRRSPRRRRVLRRATRRRAVLRPCPRPTSPTPTPGQPRRLLPPDRTAAKARPAARHLDGVRSATAASAAGAPSASVTSAVGAA